MRISQKGRVITFNARIGISKGRRKTKNEKDQKVINEVLEQKKLDVLPMYISYFIDNRKEVDGFTVRHPQYKMRYFISKNKSLIEKLDDTIQYLNTIEDSSKIIIRKKNDHLNNENVKELFKEKNISSLPQYINFSADKDGNTIGLIVRYPKQKQKKLVSKKEPLIQKYDNAFRYLKEISS